MQLNLSNVAAVLLTACAFSSFCVAAPSASQKQAEGPCTLGAYQLVETRAKVRVIVVSPSCRNLEAMNALGKKLRDDFRADSVFMVKVFDNLAAARLFHRMVTSSDGSLGDKDAKLYDKHNIGNYLPKPESFEIMLEGLDGPMQTVSFKK